MVKVFMPKEGIGNVNKEVDSGLSKPVPVCTLLLCTFTEENL